MGWPFSSFAQEEKGKIVPAVNPNALKASRRVHCFDIAIRFGAGFKVTKLFDLSICIKINS